jgi:4-carboxymuconolactone decarboxylase
MRLPPIPPESLGPELREVHDGIVKLVAGSQEHIVMQDSQGALIGPFPALLHFPRFGVPAALFQRALNTEARLPNAVRQVAILAVGASFGARYELYAHEITGAHAGLSPSQIATVASGGRPADLSEEQAIAYDIAQCLLSKRTLPTSTYERGKELLGADGVGELAYLVGGYCLISVVLNCFDVPVP